MIVVFVFLMLLLSAIFLIAARKHEPTLQVSLLSKNAKIMLGWLFAFVAIVLIFGALTGWKMKPLKGMGPVSEIWATALT